MAGYLEYVVAFGKYVKLFWEICGTGLFSRLNGITLGIFCWVWEICGIFFTLNWNETENILLVLGNM